MEDIRKNVQFIEHLSTFLAKATQLLASYREQRRLRKAAIDLRYCSEHIKKDIGWIDR